MSTWEDANYEDAIESEAVPGDLEYELVIADVKADEDKGSVMVTIEIVGNEMAKRIYKFINYKPYAPEGEEPDGRAINAMKLAQKYFFEGFNISKENTNFRMSEMWKGARATAVLSNFVDDKKPEYGHQNKITKYMRPVSETFAD